ncbi:DoxX family protein [Actinocorallia aurantiaca]|uniref:Oxidoreductase n=1 Tax=Actinocorallia aurantiaca TaxID=46204 RepID=A0ABN3UQ82_9ACTN
MRTRPAYDVIALFARCAVGIVFLVHGWQKVEAGINSTAAAFDLTGVPLAKAAAVYSTFAELLGGVALIAGLGLPVTGVLLFLDMAGAFVFVHLDRGLTGPEGSELVLVLAAASLLFAAGAGGRLTVDNALSVQRHRTAELAEDFPLAPETDDVPGIAHRPSPDTEPAGEPLPEPSPTVPDGVVAEPVPVPVPGDVPVARARGKRTK